MPCNLVTVQEEKNYFKPAKLGGKNLHWNRIEFKQSFNSRTKSFISEYYENDTELSKEHWTINRSNFRSKITWRIATKCVPFNRAKRKCCVFTES